MQATAVKIVKEERVSVEEAEKYVTELLDSQETSSKQTFDQLRRLQRDLQGLPPLTTSSVQ